MESEEDDCPIFVVCRPNCVAVVRGGETLGTFTGEEAETRACLFRKAMIEAEGRRADPATYARIGDPLGAITEGRHDSEGMKLLRALITSISTARERKTVLAVWDHGAMFALRDFIEAAGNWR